MGVGLRDLDLLKFLVSLALVAIIRVMLFCMYAKQTQLSGKTPAGNPREA